MFDIYLSLTSLLFISYERLHNHNTIVVCCLLFVVYVFIWTSAMKMLFWFSWYITRREPRPGNVHTMVAVIPPSQPAESYHILHSLMLWQHPTTYFYFVMMRVFLLWPTLVASGSTWHECCCYRIIKLSNVVDVVIDSGIGVAGWAAVSANIGCQWYSTWH